MVAITSKAFLFNFYLDIHFSSFYTSSQRACLLDGGVELGKFSNKLTAFLVVMAFFSVLQLSAFAGNEVAAGKNSASLEKNSSDEFPQVGAEKESASPTIKKKHSALPWILGGLAVATGVVLALTVFKKKAENYDIQGLWNINIQTKDTFSWKCNFIGSTSNGEVLVIAYNDEVVMKGQYSVVGSNVTFSIFTRLDAEYNFSGKFSGSNKMDGKLNVINPNFDGKWEAVRVLSN